MGLAGGVVVVAGQAGPHLVGPLGPLCCQALQAAPQGRADEAHSVLGEDRIGYAGGVDRPAVADHSSLLGHPQELGVEELDHPGPQEACPKLGQAGVGNATLIEGKAEGRLPGEVEAAPALRLSVRDPVEQLGQQQRRQHRWRVGRAPAPGRVERLEVLIREDDPTCPPERGEEALVVERSSQSTVASHSRPGRRRHLACSESAGSAQVNRGFPTTQLDRC